MRHGFTLIQVLAVAAGVLVLAVLVIPRIAGGVLDATPEAVISTMSGAADAIGRFKDDTGHYPGRLQWLASTAGAPTDICGATIPGEVLERWSGPYLEGPVGSGGIPAGDATVLDLLDRADPAATAVSFLIIKATDVSRDAAREIDEAVDGSVHLDAGAVRWVDVAGPADTLFYYYPIRGC